MIQRIFKSSIVIALLICAVDCLVPGESKGILESAIAATDKILHTLYDRWQVNDFPNFLQSVEMSETSWEVLKVKMQLKILTAVASGVSMNAPLTDKNKFVVSFLGSSVTAGHDSNFNVTTSELTRSFMKPAFDAAGIQLEVINGAMGNNPCLPYDVCVKAFAGPEADIIQWEQSYNCFGSNDDHRVDFEQFIRQTMDMKSKPVIVFSTSFSPNWDPKVCANNPQKPEMSNSDKEILAMYDSGKNIKKVAETKKDGISGQFSALLKMFQSYKMSGIQLWSHSDYEAYKCHGPYVAGWGCCSASWHPSILGHELRAAHYSFFWLSVYRDALQSTLQHLNDAKLDDAYGAMDALLAKTQKHIDHEHVHTQLTALFPSDFSDSMQCVTAFHPIKDPSADLGKYLINNIVEKPLFTKPFFTKIIFENMMDRGIVQGAIKRGYQDFKYTYYGNSDSKPLSVKIHVQKEGVVFLCQPPGVWGKLPDGFKNFWDSGAKIYITKNAADYDKYESFDDIQIPESAKDGRVTFNLNTEPSELIEFKNPQSSDSQHVCAQSTTKVPAGRHVLTIAPVTKDNIMISTILVP